ncbi:MAG: FHA domain-containing protein [Anaerolineae bacterium]|nr:FHA domain-containing protein [Anaerolineae bacterium]
MARTLLTIKSDLFDTPEGEEASVRENLPIRTLISEICKEFELPEGSYTLRQEGGKALEPDKTLEQVNVRMGAVLVFSRERRSVRRPTQLVAASGAVNLTGAPRSRAMITSSNHALLKDSTTGDVYEIMWQPAIIGRPDANNPASADILAVNLGKNAAAQTVSRQHARITELDGQYFLESMSERNPTYLNDGQVRLGEKRFLAPDDKIRVGTITLVFDIKS